MEPQIQLGTNFDALKEYFLDETGTVPRPIGKTIVTGTSSAGTTDGLNDLFYNPQRWTMGKFYPNLVDNQIIGPNTVWPETYPYPKDKDVVTVHVAKPVKVNLSLIN